MPATTGNSTIRTRELEFIMYFFLLHYARRFFCRGCTFACFTLLSRQMWVISNVCWKSVEFNVAGSWSICVCPTQKTFSTDKNQKCLTVLDRDSMHSVPSLSIWGCATDYFIQCQWHLGSIMMGGCVNIYCSQCHGTHPILGITTGTILMGGCVINIIYNIM